MRSTFYVLVLLLAACGGKGYECSANPQTYTTTRAELDGASRDLGTADAGLSDCTAFCESKGAEAYNGCSTEGPDDAVVVTCTYGCPN